jgi:hypothetical protein
LFLKTVHQVIDDINVRTIELGDNNIIMRKPSPGNSSLRSFRIAQVQDLRTMRQFFNHENAKVRNREKLSRFSSFRTLALSR